MKGFWIIVILIMVLVPLFMLSRENDKEKAEKPKEEVIIDEEPVIMEVPDIVENILYESASKFRMHMKSLEEYDDALAVSIESQKKGGIAKGIYHVGYLFSFPIACSGRGVQIKRDGQAEHRIRKITTNM